MSCEDVDTGFVVEVLPVEQVDATLAITVAGIVGTIALQVATAGYYRYEIWLANSNTVPTESLNLPTDPAQTRFVGFTNSSGAATITFKNNAASRTWYAWASIQKIEVSSAITVGT